MKILHVTKKYPGIMGGDSTVVSCLEKYQKKIGHEVYILTSNCDEIRESLTITKYGLKINVFGIDRMNLSRIISLFFLFFYSFLYLRKIKPDIIHSHSPELGFILSFACRAYKIPVINTCHGVTFPDKYYSFLKRKLEEFFLKYGYFKKIITVSRNSLSDFKKLKLKNVIYLPNGADLNLSKKRRKNAKRKTIFLFVGRIEIAKGLKYLIHAVNKLRKKEKGFKVLLVGNGIDKKFLQNLVNKLKLANYIKFLGKKDKVINYYYTSDIFILPSLHEGFPITILEAWVAKLPVIASNVGGISTICVNKENALIIPPKDPGEISKAMITLIRDQNLQRKLGENGRELVEKKYNWGNIAIEVEKVYKEVLNK